MTFKNEINISVCTVFIIMTFLVSCNTKDKSVKDSNDEEVNNGGITTPNVHPPSNMNTSTNSNHGFDNVNYIPTQLYNYPSNYNQGSNIPKAHLTIWLEDPSKEAIINWSLPDYSEDGKHYVYLSTQPHQGQLDQYELQFEANESGLYSACDKNRKHANIQAHVRNLTPNTTYYFVTVSNNERSKEMHFVTAPDNDSVRFKLLSGGDSRSNGAKRREINSSMKGLVSADPNYIALLHGGDFIATGGNCDQWLAWREDHQYSNLENGRVIPVIPTIGNHEYYGTGGAEKYEAIFGKINNFYFVSKIGNLSIVILNSETSTTGDQYTWLETKLEELTTSSNNFVVASYHRPAFPAVKNPGPAKNFVPLFEKHNLKLVFESDGHTLKQTCPIKNESCQPANLGTVYVGEGGLGVSQRTPQKQDEWYFQGSGYAKAQHHIQSLTINSSQNTMTYEVFYNNQFHHPLNFTK